MNELFDKLIIRIILTLFICFMLIIYKYIHLILYPHGKKQIFKFFDPIKNSADTIHFFSRLIGIGIIFSAFSINISDGIILGIIDIFIVGIVALFTYLISLYVIESISLYNFDYVDEIIKRKNLSYAVICFAQAIGMAFILKSIITVSANSLILFLLLWAFALMLVGITIKTFTIISKLNLNKYIYQKNLSAAFSYLGFFIGISLIISVSLHSPFKSIERYGLFIISKLMLSLIILPIFKYGLNIIFKINGKVEDSSLEFNTSIGYGIYEGISFATACFLTTVITNNINFGSFYP